MSQLGGLGARLVAKAQAELRAVADAGKAAKKHQYSRKQHVFYGVQAAERRVVSKAISASLATAPQTAVHDFVVGAFDAQCKREMNVLATDVLVHLSKDTKRGGLGDVAALDTVKFALTTGSWWDTVDPVAVHALGGLVKRFPEELVPVMDTWAQHDNKWLRRSAILHQLSYRNKTTDLERLQRHIDWNLGEDQDFFIRKSVGWALRQLSKEQHDFVRDFCAERAPSSADKGDKRLSKLSFREATKYVDMETKKEASKKRKKAGGEKDEEAVAALAARGKAKRSDERQ